MKSKVRGKILSHEQRRKWRKAFLFLWFCVFIGLVALFYGRSLTSYLSLDDENRIVQAYLNADDVPRFFQCDRLYGHDGKASLSRWHEDPDGVNSGDTLQGEPWHYTIRNGTRVVTGSEGLEGKPKIIFLGESSMFGYALPDEQTLPSYFQALVGEEYQVINLASSGLDMEELLANWQKIAALKPSILVIAMSQNCLWNYLTTMECLGLLHVSVLAYRPTNLNPVLQTVRRWRNWWKQEILDQKIVKQERVMPTAYLNNLEMLFQLAGSINTKVIFLEHAFIFKNIETTSGFKEIELFRQMARQVIRKYQIPYVKMADFVDKVKPEPGAPAGNALTRMLELGYSEQELSRVFHSQEAFVDMLHPSACMNKMLARSLKLYIPNSNVNQ